MTTVQVTEKTFDSSVKQGIVLLDFEAAWRGPCRTFGILEAVASRHPDAIEGTTTIGAASAPTLPAAGNGGA